MAQVQHTPGPWELDIEEYGFRIRMGSAVPYTGIYEPQHVIEWDPGVYPSEDQDEADAEHRQYLEAKANMERIVAAVNAVEGIPTEALEAGVVRKLIEAATETALALLGRIEALEAMLLRLYQDTVVPNTHYCHRCGVIGGHDEVCAMAEVEKLLGLGVASDGEAEGGASDGR